MVLEMCYMLPFSVILLQRIAIEGAVDRPGHSPHTFGLSKYCAAIVV